MKYQSHTSLLRKGFTLLELTLVMVIGLMIASVTLVLFNQQMMMFSAMKTQDFMVNEAPQINSILNKIIPQADSFLIYSSADKVANSVPVQADGQVIVLRFDGANLSEKGESELHKTFGVIAFDGQNNGRLNYYSGITDLALFDPSKPTWAISTRVTKANFFIEKGVLRVKIKGPHKGSITYSESVL